MTSTAFSHCSHIIGATHTDLFAPQRALEVVRRSNPVSLVDQTDESRETSKASAPQIEREVNHNVLDWTAETDGARALG